MLITGAARIKLSTVDLTLDGNSLFSYLLNTENATIYGTLGGAGRTKQNLAIGGSSTASLASDAATRIDSQVASNKVLIFWECRNHLYLGATLTEAKNAIRDYCLARKSAGWQRILLLNCSPTTGGFATNNTGLASFEAALLDCNAWMAANYRDFANGLLDVRGIAGLQNPADTSAYYDGIHLSTQGYGYLVPAINTAIGRMRRLN
jgi:hypothetical protein